VLLRAVAVPDAHGEAQALDAHTVNGDAAGVALTLGVVEHALVGSRFSVLGFELATLVEGEWDKKTFRL
jgi:hypothetical protein